MKYYVYALCDPRIKFETDICDFKPVYIGKGSKERWKSHIKEALGICKPKSKNFLKINTLKEIFDNGYEPILKIIHNNLDQKTAYELEIQYIKKYGRIDLDQNGILTNRVIDQKTLGGGKKGTKHKKERSIEHREKIKKYRTGQKWTDEQRSKRCGEGNPMYGKKANETTKKLMSDKRSGSKNPNALEWTIKLPSNNTIIVKGLRQWCLQNNIKYFEVYHSRNGYQSSKTEKGKGGRPKNAIL